MNPAFISLIVSLSVVGAPERKAITPDPLTLFSSACLGGEVALDPDLVKHKSFNSLPFAAKAAIGGSLYRGPGSPPYPETLFRKDMPNPVYRVADEDLYLIATTSEPVPGARFADSCMVLWRGDGFEKARVKFLPYAFKSPRSASKTGIGYVSANDGQQVITIALRSGWTVLRASASESEILPPNPFTGALKK